MEDFLCKLLFYASEGCCAREREGDSTPLARLRVVRMGSSEVEDGGLEVGEFFEEFVMAEGRSFGGNLVYCLVGEVEG